MKSFKEFIKEQKENKAPYGVIFDNNKIIVGKDHKKSLILSDDLIKKIKNIKLMKKYLFTSIQKNVGQN